MKGLASCNWSQYKEDKHCFSPDVIVGMMKTLTVLVFLCVCPGHVRSQSTSIWDPACFDNQKCPCCSVSCQSDGNGQCAGKCIDGYHGMKCYNRCPNNCISCTDSQTANTANCTKCKDGYYSTATLYQCQSNCSSNCKTCALHDTNCTSCQDGFYLENHVCTACNESCRICSSKQKCTSCKVGYFFDNATWTCRKCNPLCFSCDSIETCFCSNGCALSSTEALEYDCLYETNACRFGCKHTFTSENASKNVCDKCVEGMYGHNCNLSCNVNCYQKMCERLEGKCDSCIKGFYGNNCDKRCHKNCECDRDTGGCITCNEGFFGNNCTEHCIDQCVKCNILHGTCLVCLNGFYGNTCNKTCSENCQDKKCNMTNGDCTCVSGYMGRTCEVRLTTTVTVSNLPPIVIEDPQKYVGSMVGGTLSGILVLVVGVIFVLYRKRQTVRYVRYDIDLDSYKLDARLIDVLEENDEFDPTYFTGKVVDTMKPCGKLPVKVLAQFVDTRGEDFFKEEFLKLPRGLIKSYDDAKKEENVVKNRYTGIYPYDEHRVMLQPPGSDFINACYVDGFKRKKEYIASLGPTRKAMEGFQLFWRMVWQEKTDIIVMVTNLMEGESMKCEQYWPDIGTSSTHGEITVTSQTEDVHAEFVVRALAVTKDREQRTLHHLHYTAWPDKRVPDDVTSLIEFRQKVKATGFNLGGPTIVHCSAGIGRTGTYIALDILIHQGKAQKFLDIFEWVTRMREQRTSMVQTWQQYEYLHKALVHALTFHCEPVKQSKIGPFMESLNDKKMARLFKQLSRKQEKPTEGEQEARETHKGLEGMNREGTDIPGSLHRPFLHLDKKFGENNYINALYLNSYMVKNRFLVCQTPLPDTVKDFLTLIMQESCSCIVSMDPPGLRDQTIGEYYPATAGTIFSHPSYIFDVESQVLDTNPSYSLRRLTIHFNKRSGTTSRTVYHFQFQNWPHGNRVPDVSHFLQLVQDVENMADRDSDRGPILVHCLNAAERSGLYCAVSNLIQKMTLEGEVSVVNTLRQVKVRRPLAIANKEQYMFCYRCLQFMNSQSHINDEAVYGNIE